MIRDRRRSGTVEPVWSLDILRVYRNVRVGHLEPVSVWPLWFPIRSASLSCAARPIGTHMVFETIALRQNPTAAPALETPTSPAEPLPAWLEQLRESVPSTTYKKGSAYASSGRVSLLSTQAGRVVARVQGSSGEEYSVEVQITDRTGGSPGDCPAWNKYG